MRSDQIREMLRDSNWESTASTYTDEEINRMYSKYRNESLLDIEEDLNQMLYRYRYHNESIRAEELEIIKRKISRIVNYLP